MEYRNATDRQTDRQADRQTNRQTGGQTDRIAISISRVSVLDKDLWEIDNIIKPPAGNYNHAWLTYNFCIQV